MSVGLTTLEMRFVEFHTKHPEAYERICELADHLIKRGAKKLSINMMIEMLRYERQERGEKAFKVFDSVKPYYARLWNKQHPGPVQFKLNPLRTKGNQIRSGVTSVVT